MEVARNATPSPAYNSAEGYGYTPHGGTGAGVRTFVQFLEDQQ